MALSMRVHFHARISPKQDLKIHLMSRKNHAGSPLLGPVGQCCLEKQPVFVLNVILSLSLYGSTAL
jgi:hypothetical protein